MRKVEIKILNKKAQMPEYATQDSAAFDLRAMIDKPIIVNPNESVVIPSGIAIHIDDSSLAATLLPRSGLGIKHGIVLGNLVGLIDSDYSKEVFVSVWNRSDDTYKINPNDRICQMMFVPVVKVELDLVEEFSVHSARGGLGSTGLQ